MYRFKIYNTSDYINHESIYSYRVGDKLIENDKIYTIISIMGTPTVNTSFDIEGIIIEI